MALLQGSPHRACGEHSVGFVRPVPTHTGQHVSCSLFKERSSEGESVQWAGEIWKGFLEESLANAVKIGSDWDRAEEGGETQLQGSWKSKSWDHGEIGFTGGIQ